MALSDIENTKTGDARTAILRTLIYSDIFGFPQTKEEIWEYLISGDRISRSAFEGALNKLKGEVIQLEGYYALAGRGEYIKKRISNNKYVHRKMKIAKKAAFLLAAIPTILFIGISGGLAIGDAEKRDDIDFFIITKKNTIFKTRLFILILLQAMGLRRKRLDKKPEDKVCVNFLIDETKLSFPSERKDIYTAREILQIKPLFDRENTYLKFLMMNKWIKNFLPNANIANNPKTNLVRESHLHAYFWLLIGLLPIEKICRMLQKKVMEQHLGNETVTNHVLIFNPNDYRLQTLDKLRLKLLETGLLTKT
jgi:hypothetical protein